MATKKQKRVAALEKRMKFMEQYKADGLAAQKKSQEEYEQQIREHKARVAKIDEDNNLSSIIAILRLMNPK